MTVRTRFAPSPTGYMHIGNLRTALFEYLIAKKEQGQFILRIENTDVSRVIKDAEEIIYNSLKLSGIIHDEGPDIGGPYAPYIQSERTKEYMKYARLLIDKKSAYYCFCTKDDLESIPKNAGREQKYDKHCIRLSPEEIENRLNSGVPFVIRQNIQTGFTTFDDAVFGSITVNNDDLDDQILIKSDGMPTYNFANVVDDHLMNITHVVRGSEYLSSTPKYNLLYQAFGWQVPKYIHLPLILGEDGQKLSKRKGATSFIELIEQGYLPYAIINYIALLGFSPNNNQEIFSLKELLDIFDISCISKSPATFDLKKLTWINSEWFKRLSHEEFSKLAIPQLQKAIKLKNVDLEFLTSIVKSRISFISDIDKLVAFIDTLPEYSTDLYINKRMKTTKASSLKILKDAMIALKDLANWDSHTLHDLFMLYIDNKNIKTGQALWPIRTALSGEKSSPCGATELLSLLGKEESLTRIALAISKLEFSLK